MQEIITFSTGSTLWNIVAIVFWLGVIILSSAVAIWANED